MGITMLKNSPTRNLQKLDRVRKLYKRFFPVSWTFSITRFLTFLRKTEFFNSHSSSHHLSQEDQMVWGTDSSSPSLTNDLACCNPICDSTRNEKLCHQPFLLSLEKPPPECEPSDRPDRRALSHLRARFRFLPESSGPIVPVAPR